MAEVVQPPAIPPEWVVAGAAPRSGVSRWVARGLRLYYELLSYFIFAVFAPIGGFFTREQTRTTLRLLNRAFIGYRWVNREDVESHRTLELYRRTYDRSGWQIYDRIARRDEWLTGKSLLDLGCFVGGKTECYLDAGAGAVVGIDLSGRAIEVARRFSRERLTYLEMSTADLRRAGYERSFDTIVSFTVFEHIERLELVDVVNDCYELLKPGGMLLIAFHHYLDRYGSHLGHFVYFPWPTLMFPEDAVFEYCDEQLAGLQARGLAAYYPDGFSFRSALHPAICHMTLNRVTVDEFVRLVADTKFGRCTAIPYSQTPMMRLLARLGIGRDLFRGSCLYRFDRRAGDAADTISEPSGGARSPSGAPSAAS